MKKNWLSLGFVLVGTLAAILLVVGAAQATEPQAPPTVTDVSPSSVPNDLDTQIVITGTGFVDVPTVTLGVNVLDEVGWVSSTTLTATVPWGLIPGTYPLTVTNPSGGSSSSLTDAFTVTQGLGVWTTNGPYGGTIRQVLVNPFTPTTVYAVADGVGLFASDDSAAHWEPILEGKTYQFSIAIDAVDPDELYGGGGGYVYRTQDGGETWEELVGRSSELHHCYVHRLATHPTVNGSLYDAVSACEDWIPPVDRSGIYFSDDHGTSWITLTVGLTDTNFTAVAVQPQDPDTILGGTESGNLFLSQDGGQTWDWTAKLDGKVYQIDFNPHAASEAWASSRSLIGNLPSDLYKSINLTDWFSVTVDPGLTQGENGWDMIFFTDTTWAASVGVYTTIDGGATWLPVDNWHDSAISLDVAPDDPARMYIGAFRNGLYRSGDGGSSWQLANDGLAGLNPSAIAVEPSDPDTVYAQTELGILKSNNAGQNWRQLDLFTGGYPAPNELATDPFTPERVYFGQYGDPNLQGEIIFCLSEDGGTNWQQITITLPITMVDWSGSMYAIAPHPTVPDRILGGATVAPAGSGVSENDAQGLIFASDDHGQNWTLLSPTLPISEIHQIAVDAVNPDLIYVATLGSGLWKSTDGGDSWAATPVTGTAEVPYVVADPLQENKVYFGTSTIDGPINYVSENAADTWTRINSEIEYGEPLLFTPAQPPELYAACHFSERLCRSLDGGATWQYVSGMTRPGALAAGTDGERVLLYVGSPGGIVTTEGLDNRSPEILEPIPGRGSVLGGGVYRYTTLLPDHQIYLPLLFKSYGP